jgi:hypothetical protein
MNRLRFRQDGLDKRTRHEKRQQTAGAALHMHRLVHIQRQDARLGLQGTVFRIQTRPGLDGAFHHHMKHILANGVGGNPRHGSRLGHRIGATVHEHQIGDTVTVNRATEAIAQLRARDRHVEKVPNPVSPRRQLQSRRFVVRAEAAIDAFRGSRVPGKGICRHVFSPT